MTFYGILIAHFKDGIIAIANGIVENDKISNIAKKEENYAYSYQDNLRISVPSNYTDGEI